MFKRLINKYRAELPSSWCMYLAYDHVYEKYGLTHTSVARHLHRISYKGVRVLTYNSMNWDISWYSPEMDDKYKIIVIEALRKANEECERTIENRAEAEEAKIKARIDEEMKKVTGI